MRKVEREVREKNRQDRQTGKGRRERGREGGRRTGRREGEREGERGVVDTGALVLTTWAIKLYSEATNSAPESCHVVKFTCSSHTMGRCRPNPGSLHTCKAIAIKSLLLCFLPPQRRT